MDEGYHGNTCWFELSNLLAVECEENFMLTVLLLRPHPSATQHVLHLKGSIREPGLLPRRFLTAGNFEDAASAEVSRSKGQRSKKYLKQNSVAVAKNQNLKAH